MLVAILAWGFATPVTAVRSQRTEADRGGGGDDRTRRNAWYVAGRGSTPGSRSGGPPDCHGLCGCRLLRRRPAGTDPVLGRAQRHAVVATNRNRGGRLPSRGTVAVARCRGGRVRCQPSDQRGAARGGAHGGREHPRPSPGGHPSGPGRLPSTARPSARRLGHRVLRRPDQHARERHHRQRRRSSSSDAIRSPAAGAWAVWWTGDAMGVLAVAPFLLCLPLFWEHRRGRSLAGSRPSWSWWSLAPSPCGPRVPSCR